MAFTNRNPYQKYRQAEVESLTQGQLIVMLYDGAIRFLEDAADKVEDFRQYDLVNEKLIKVQDIISELMVSLNMDAGEVAVNLLSIYVYLKNTLVEANMTKEKSKIMEVLKHLRSLRDAWSEIADKDPSTLQDGKSEQSAGGISFTG